jgi:hypothetical protein
LAASRDRFKGRVVLFFGCRLIPKGFGAFRAPSGTVFDDPIEKGAFESNIVALLLALDPLVTENFVPFGQKFFVEDGVFDQVVHLGRGRVHDGNNLFGVSGESIFFPIALPYAGFSIRDAKNTPR